MKTVLILFRRCDATWRAAACGNTSIALRKRTVACIDVNKFFESKFAAIKLQSPFIVVHEHDCPSDRFHRNPRRQHIAQVCRQDITLV